MPVIGGFSECKAPSAVAEKQSSSVYVGYVVEPDESSKERLLASCYGHLTGMAALSVALIMLPSLCYFLHRIVRDNEFLVILLTIMTYIAVYYFTLKQSQVRAGQATRRHEILSLAVLALPVVPLMWWVNLIVYVRVMVIPMVTVVPIFALLYLARAHARMERWRRLSLVLHPLVITVFLSAVLCVVFYVLNYHGIVRFAYLYGPDLQWGTAIVCFIQALIFCDLELIISRRPNASSTAVMHFLFLDTALPLKPALDYFNIKPDDD